MGQRKNIPRRQIRTESYNYCREAALATLRTAANDWAKGDPESPSSEEVLEHLLAPFIEFRFITPRT
jgi:hypothetical protein